MLGFLRHPNLQALIAWTQADPLYRFAADAAWTQPRRASLYSADLNNPLRYQDPDGRNGNVIGNPVFQWGLDTMGRTVQSGNKAAMVGATVLLVGITVYAVADTLFEPIDIEGMIATMQASEAAAAARGAAFMAWWAAMATGPIGPPAENIGKWPRFPDTGYPEDTEKDPNRGHPYRERPPQWPWPPGPKPLGGAGGEGKYKGEPREDAPLFGSGLLGNLDTYAPTTQSTKTVIDFDVPCLACSVYLEHSRNQIDLEWNKRYQ